jgi:hypothetical protein
MASIFQCAPNRLCRALSVLSALFFAWHAAAPPLLAVTPESPEVRELIESGKKFLDSNTDHRLGGKCLIALVFLKEGASLNHPRIVEALKACKEEIEEPGRLDNYSNGLAIIFLAELNNPDNQKMLEAYVNYLMSQQRKDGGWGYIGYSTGDTSQTQYAALSFWELMRVGHTPSVQSVDACANWILRTQDPSGTWGYQGIDPGNFNLVPQSADSSTHSSMLAAGMGSLMIFGNILGILQPNQQAQEETPQEKTPSALQLADKEKAKKLRTLSGTSVDRERVMKAIEQGQAWFKKNFQLAGSHYPCYVLYSLERYKSFEELLTGDVPSEPEWYQMGYQYLKANQGPNGSWKGGAGPSCETAFAVLFLIRSTQKSIKASLGEGTLVGGRGLSADLSRMKLKGGRLVAEEKPTEVDNLLNMLEGEGNEGLESLLNDPAALRVQNVGPDDARRLQQIVKSGQPEARVLAVQALSQMRSLDYVPTLLFAMTDPDHRVVRAASDGLQYVSRRFDSYGLPDNFTENQRHEALDRWKAWYRRARPNAPPIP